jgi:hypothetical protein
MIIPERPSLERRLLDALDRAPGAPGRIPVLLGGCGTGRTSALLRLRDLVGRAGCQYIDVERIATTPERALAAIAARTPFAAAAAPPAEATARDAFDALVAFLQTARTRDGGPATVLLDEFLELRTFESFPGLRTVLRDLVSGLARTTNRFVLTSRYTARTLKLLRDAPDAFEIVHVTPLTQAEIRATLPGRAEHMTASSFSEAEHERGLDELARLVHALSDGRPVYARAIAETAGAMGPAGADPVSALSALLAEDGALARTCRFCYELRLHRARGYGALKAILGVLAAEEPLTLTEIAVRLGRTPGSTKDYLSWLEDVDLLTSQRKRYSFSDPLLRLWVRLHTNPEPPGDEDLAREVHAYVMARLPETEPSEPELAAAGPRRAPVADREKDWGIIEID